MVNLRTIRRALAVDLGLDPEAVERCLTTVLPLSAAASDATEFPLAEAVRIVAMAEELVLA